MHEENSDREDKKTIKRVTLCGKKTTLTAFDFESSDVHRLFKQEKDDRDDQVDSGILGISKGTRFDYRNHHWLLFQDYISLSFSYMAFVIKRNLEQNDGLV